MKPRLLGTALAIGLEDGLTWRKQHVGRAED